MANELGAAVHADLASIKTAALDMVGTAEAMPMPAADGGAAGSGSGFLQSMRDAVSSVNAQDSAAASKVADVDAGRSDDLVGAMLASQEASLSFSMLMQVRNKVMGAVEDLMKLPL